MEPIGWVSCGCGKGVNIYARKQEAKKTHEKVVKEVAKTYNVEDLSKVKAPGPKVAQTKNREKAVLDKRTCLWCGKPFECAQTSHLKCCTWNCYLKKKAQAEQMRAITALGSSSLLPAALDEDAGAEAVPLIPTISRDETGDTPPDV